MKLEKMTSLEFKVFIEESKKNVATGRSRRSGLPLDICLQRANDEVQRILPQGLETPNHFFYNLKDPSSSVVGRLWFGKRTDEGIDKAFIYDIVVLEAHRGKGYGKLMMAAAETEAKVLGLSEIYLHVVGENKVARKLYEDVGYEVTNVYMAKKLR